MLPSGRIDRSYGRDGITRFPGNADSLSSSGTSLLRIGSGRVLSLTSVYGSTSAALISATVRAFTTGGAIDRSFGTAGVRVIDLRTLPRTEYWDIALAPAHDRGAWIVIGFPKEVDLIPVRP